MGTIGPKAGQATQKIVSAQLTQHSYITHVEASQDMTLIGVSIGESHRNSSMDCLFRPLHHKPDFLPFDAILLFRVQCCRAKILRPFQRAQSYIVVTGILRCCKLCTSNNQNTTVRQAYHFHSLTPTSNQFYYPKISSLFTYFISLMVSFDHFFHIIIIPVTLFIKTVITVFHIIYH